MKILFIGGTETFPRTLRRCCTSAATDFGRKPGAERLPAPYRTFQADRKDLTAMRAALKGCGQT